MATDGAILLLGYLLGSIPFGYLIVRMASGADIRETGSGGTGATNVTRRAGKWAGVVTLVLDALKGTAAVLLARWLTGEAGTTWIVAAAGVLAVVGHCFPVWLGFRAGKGVATGLGVFIAIVPTAVLASLVLFILVVGLTRYVSLGSILAAVFVPLWTAGAHLLAGPVTNFAPTIASLLAVAALIVGKHHENIERLLAGTENRFGASGGRKQAR